MDNYLHRYDVDVPPAEAAAAGALPSARALAIEREDPPSPREGEPDSREEGPATPGKESPPAGESTPGEAWRGGVEPKAGAA